ncbi:MAG: hypothetical protein FWG39_00335 [Alphaproteobacteria bacterium]|nr:hypothetical protein [Alphaproteobacteria bacterium]
MNKLVNLIITLGVIAVILFAGYFFGQLVAEHTSLDAMFSAMAGILVGIAGGYFVLPKIVK